tara:strand:- start:1431 stop:1694 length:264 start_codon:yes stop_codon:yes gene_type:complete
MWVLDQALRRRKCGECKAKIPPNKFHLAVWSNKSIRVGMGSIIISTRSNICLACVEKYAEDLKIRNDEQDKINNKSKPNNRDRDLPF